MTALQGRINCIDGHESIRAYCLHCTSLAGYCGKTVLIMLSTSIAVAAQDRFEDCWPCRAAAICGKQHRLYMSGETAQHVVYWAAC